MDIKVKFRKGDAYLERIEGTCGCTLQREDALQVCFLNAKGDLLIKNDKKWIKKKVDLKRISPKKIVDQAMDSSLEMFIHLQNMGKI